MPWVQIAFAGQPDEAAKARLIERVTALITEELKAPPAAVNVWLTRIAPEDWGVAGVPLAVTFRERARAAGVTEPRRARSVWTRSDELTLHALDFAGSAPAIVIVPGITSPAATWRFVVDALGVPNRIIVLDNRGRGRSDAPASGYRREDYAGDIAAWVRELALDAPIVLGHSMGAQAAAAYSANADAPLIAIDPPMSGPERAYPTPLEFYLDGLKAAATGGPMDSFRASSPGWSDARIKDRIEWLPTCSVSAITESHAHFHDEAFLDVWSKGKAEALFVRGARSPVVLEGDLAEIRAARPKAEIANVPDAGHMIPWDNLTDFVSAVRPWIERLTAAHLANRS